MKYDAKFVKKVCEELTDVATDPCPREGICGQLSDEVCEWIAEQFDQWEHFSGNYAYPISVNEIDVWGVEIGPSQQYYDAKSRAEMWDTDTEYGRMRWDLLAFLLERASKLEVK